MLTNGDTKCALNIPNMRETKPFLWLSRNAAGASGPQRVYGNSLPSPLSAGGAARSERGQSPSVESTGPTAGNRKQEHAAETIPVCTEKRRRWHARLTSIRVKKLPLNLVRAGLSVLQVSSGWGDDETVSTGVTVNLALGREGWQKAFHTL